MKRIEKELLKKGDKVLYFNYNSNGLVCFIDSAIVLKNCPEYKQVRIRPIGNTAKWYNYDRIATCKEEIPKNEV